MSTKTQCDLVLGHLKAGKSVTALEALRRWGVARLAARCLELKRRGVKIASVRERVRKSDGTQAHVSRYYLAS